ncbi:serine-threonine protein kinase, partial [Streptomyces sp. ms191]
MAGMSVEPYREITFDKDGDGAAGQHEALSALAARGATDGSLFHPWANTTRSVATRMYAAFFASFPGVVRPGARMAYAGLVWPSTMFTDEPIPDFESVAAVHPGKEAVVERLSVLLREQPEDEAAFTEFGDLLRELTDTGSASRSLAEGP